MKILYKFLGEHIFSVFLSIYLGIERSCQFMQKGNWILIGIEYVDQFMHYHCLNRQYCLPSHEHRVTIHFSSLFFSTIFYYYI